MAVNNLLGFMPAALGLLDLGGIKERRDDRRGADPNCHAGFHKLSTPFVVTLRLVPHSILTLAGRTSPYDEGRRMGRVKEAKCAGA